MWGNTLGWIISGIMFIAASSMFYRLATPPPPTPPAHLIPDALVATIALPPEAEQVMPLGSRDIDAGALYAQAVIQFKASPKPYDDPIHSSPSDLPALQLLRQASDSRRMVLFESHPQQLVNYDNNHPELEALLKIANAANTQGLGALLDGKSDDATQLFKAVFVLGRHLFDERVTWDEMNAGLEMMSTATQNLAKLTDQTSLAARANLLHRAQEALDRYRASLQESVASPLINPVESYAGKYSGDIFAIARDTDAPRVWRVHAILHLGRYKWNVADGHGGDQVWAHREIRALENSIETGNSDPIIRLAIDTAENLTLEQQRKSTVN